MKFFGRGTAGVALLLAGILLAGCQSENSDASYKFDPLTGVSSTNGAVAGAPASPATGDASPSETLLHIGDEIVVSFADTPVTIAPIDDTIKEDGTITLIYNQRFQAAGKTIGALQEEARKEYVPQYFKYLTVSIKIQGRFYSVGGEVRTPNRNLYAGRMTVVGAIDTAGGFTDFARRSKIQVTRANGKKITVDYYKALKHPDKDIEIFPGDMIFVPKRIF